LWRKSIKIASIKYIVFLVTVFFLSIGFGASAQFYQPEKGLVPDTTTAIKIAEAVWLPIYGKEIYSELPFKAVLSGDSAWYVYGYLPPSHISIDKNGDTTFYIVHGGVAEILIRKSDGKIFGVMHGK